jgi:hypothetical protein
MEQVFISYARADDKAFVDRLFHDLEANDIKVWWDHEAMESREKSFLHQIRDAIYKSDRLIAVVGPHAVKSDYVWYEWGHALLFLKELIPILRKGNYDLLADKMTNQLCKDYYGQLPNAFNRSDLAGLHCPDFRNDDNYDRELKKLLRTLKKPVKALPPIKPKEPFVPERFFPRRQKLLDLSELVIPDFKRPVAPSLSVRMTAIQGRGGSGKSVLASVFVKSVKVRMSYENGVVWITLGPETAVLSAMREAGATLGDKSSNYVDERIAEILLMMCATHIRYSPLRRLWASDVVCCSPRGQEMLLKTWAPSYLNWIGLKLPKLVAYWQAGVGKSKNLNRYRRRRTS